MRIAVIGPGGIGCLFAGLLAETGHDVVLIDRRPERAALIAREGLVIESAAGLRRIALRASAFPAACGRADLIILCVKAHETAGTAPSVSALAAPGAKLLCLQNGLGHPEMFRPILAEDNIFAGVTTNGTTPLGLNHIRHAGAGQTVIGALGHDRPGAEMLANLFSQSGIEAAATADTAGMLWSKLVINAAICPVSVLAGQPNGELVRAGHWRALLRRAAIESAAIAAARGIKLSFSDPVQATEEVCLKTALNFSSMLQDVRRGRQTEIAEINGAIIRAAAELGREAPVNRMLLEKIVELEKDKEYNYA